MPGFDQKDLAECADAEGLVARAMHMADSTARDELLESAYRLLLPLVGKQLPAAQYLYACNFLSRECDRQEAIEARYIELIQAAAHGAHAAAQFRLGQMFDSGGELGHDAERSAHCSICPVGSWRQSVVR